MIHKLLFNSEAVIFYTQTLEGASRSFQAAYTETLSSFCKKVVDTVHSFQAKL